MKILHQLWKLKLGVRSTVLLLVTIGTLVLRAAEASSPEPVPAVIAAAPPTPNATVAATNYPAGVSEIVRMLNANVDRDTVKAYIHNSFTYWNLSADDIIRLKNQGVPSDVVSAMLDRNAELRDQAMRAAQVQATANPATAASGPYGTAPTVANTASDTGPYAPTYVYPPDYSYGYAYPYPVDYYGWYGWPVWGGGVIFFDSFGHCHVNHHHDGHSFHNGFHNGSNNGFHNGANNFHGSFNNGFNRANSQAVNGFPGVSRQVGGLGFNHNAANLQANNGFPGTSLPRSTAVPQRTFNTSRSVGSMPSVPRMGGASSVHFGSMGGTRTGGISMGHSGGSMGGGGHGFGR